MAKGHSGDIIWVGGATSALDETQLYYTQRLLGEGTQLSPWEPRTRFKGISCEVPAENTCDSPNCSDDGVRFFNVSMLSKQPATLTDVTYMDGGPEEGK